MLFIEKLCFWDVFQLLWRKQRAFYAVKSLGARFAERFLARFGKAVNATKIDFGNVQSASGIRRRAYKNAEIEMDKLPGQSWANSLSSLLNIDFKLIFKKYFFDEIYIKFEFIEMALRFAEENPVERYVIIAAPEFLNAYYESLVKKFDLRLRKNTSFAGVITLFLLPFFVEYFWLRKGRSDNLYFENKIICEVDAEKTYIMFSSLFSDFQKDRLIYCVEQRNFNALSHHTEIRELGLRPEGIVYLRRVVWKYIFISFFNFPEIGGFGSRLFRIFYILMQGKADTVEGAGNVYLTYEHLITTKAVRNEYLRQSGNKTVFVPMNGHVTPQFFHSEILLNYDVLCSAGPHVEKLYKQKRALTSNYLPTGSYDSHRKIINFTDKEQRLGLLKHFNQDAIAVTIISPGICDPTYRHELRLMELARKLAELDNVRVSIRLKPVAPEPKYSHFYEEQCGSSKRILLTSGEYELFDFLETTDIFITTISNAAFDLVQAGAQVFFLDYLRDPELMLCWEETAGVLVSEELALESVLAWVNDFPGARAQRSALMHDFSEKISYQFPSFNSYRANFIRLLTENNLV